MEFVKSLKCAACGVVGYSENAHVLGNGGLSRKGDYTGIAPLCGPHIDPSHPGIDIGCHRHYDDYLADFYRDFSAFDPAKAAAETQAAWQSASQPTGERE